MNIGNRIKSYTKTIADDTNAVQWVYDGLRDIVMRYTKMAPTQLFQFGISKAVPDTGLVLKSGAPILDVELDSVSAYEIQSHQRFKVQDSSSIYYATATSPVFWKLSEKLHVFPTPTNGASVNISAYETHDTGNQTKFTTATTHDFRPGDMVTISGVNNVVTPDLTHPDSAALYNLSHQVSSIPANNQFIIEQDFSNNADVTGPPTVVRPAATANVIDYDQDIELTHTQITGFPSELLHVLTHYVACAELSGQMLDIKEKMPSDLNALTTVLTGTDAAGLYGALSLSLTDVPFPKTADNSDVDIRDAQNYFDVYQITKDGEAGAAATTIADWTMMFTDEISDEITKLESFINDDEDPELAQIKLAEIQLKMGKITQEFQAAQTKYSGYLAEQADLDRAYGAALQRYQIDVANKIQEWNANWQRKMQLFTTKIQKHMQDYSFLQNQLQYCQQKYEQSFGSITPGA